MSIITKVCKKAAGEARNVAIDMRGKLDEGEFLIGTPVVAEVDTSHLTLSSKTISDEDLVIEDQLVPAGQAVQFRVAGGHVGRKYTIRVTVQSSAVPAQTLIENVLLSIISD